MQPRKNELTAVAKRNLFDDLPGGVAGSLDIKRWHDFRVLYHRAQRLEDVGNWPLQVDFELNSTCQMRCAFCTHGQGKVKKRVLPFETFKRDIHEGEEYGLVSIKLNYINEPLLNKDLPKYIEYARSKGVLNIYFATNGLLLNEAMSRRLIDARLSKIMISLDATTSETFYKMRASKRFDQIVDNICRLIELRNEAGVSYPLVRVNFLETEINRHEADAFRDMWTGIADMLGYQSQVNRPGTDDVKTDSTDFGCAFPFKLVTVDSSGLILPCCTFSGREMPLGHTSRMTIAEAWTGMAALRRLHQCGNYQQNAICKHCIGA